MEVDKDGKRVGTGKDGADGYLFWCAVNEPKTYMALLPRLLPYFVTPDLPEQILTREETLAELKERGLPIELLEHLRRAPQILDDGENPDPYGIMQNVTPEVPK